MATALIRTFRLSDDQTGVRCGGAGAYVGDVALLEKIQDASGRWTWSPRDGKSLSDCLSRTYGLPINIATKRGGLATIARALNDGDVARAQIATLNLQMPDPPSGENLKRDAMMKLAIALDITGLLAKDWNPDEHPRWLAGAPDSQGGEFAAEDQDLGFVSDRPSHGTQVAANGSLDGIIADGPPRGERIADVAWRYRGSQAYLQYNDSNGKYPYGKDKCNFAVADWIEEANLPRPQVRYPDLRGKIGVTRAPDAHEWGSARVQIRGWSAPMPVSQARPGDVVAEAYEDGQGHVGIVVGIHLTASVDALTDPKGIVVINDWGFRISPGNGERNGREHPVVRRYIGEE